MTIGNAELVMASMHLVVGQGVASLRHRWRYGESPLVVYTASDSAHRRTSRVVGALSTLWAVLLVVTGRFGYGASSLLGRPLVAVPSSLVWALALEGLVAMSWAQSSLGAAFRVGQDASRPPTALKETGLYAWSRNPIYVASFVTLASMTLWHATLPMLVTLAAIGAGMHRLVLEEEGFLRAQFGAAFDDYTRRVSRYLGRP